MLNVIVKLYVLITSIENYSEKHEILSLNQNSLQLAEYVPQPNDNFNDAILSTIAKYFNINKKALWIKNKIINNEINGDTLNINMIIQIPKQVQQIGGFCIPLPANLTYLVNYL